MSKYLLGATVLAAHSIWLWLILAATLVMQILEYGGQRRRRQQATSTQQT